MGWVDRPDAPSESLRQEAAGKIDPRPIRWGSIVTSRRRETWHPGRVLGISLLILSAVHVPLPQADYHNIRHHDSPGEICVYHDHLLRWHPSAASDDDVTMLHWHWFVPLLVPGDRQQQTDDEQHHPGSGPALHAHLGDWPEPDWRGEPTIRPDSRGRLLEHLTLGLSSTGLCAPSAQLAPIDPDPGSLSARPPGDPTGLRASRSALFQRWNC
jgi:hypothetical protein